MFAWVPPRTTWSPEVISEIITHSLLSAHHLRIEVPGVLMDQPYLAGVGNNQSEAQEDHQDVHRHQSLLTPRFGQQSQADSTK